MRRASTDQRLRRGVCGSSRKRKHSQRQYYTLLFEEQERHQSVAMEAELLAVETRLSGRPAQEMNDTTALTGEQQSMLDKQKVTLRIENELYLRRHPELHTLFSSFVSEVLLKKPQSIREFAAGYFSDPSVLQQRHSPEADNSQNTES